jgi:hypothetical protein
MNSENFPEFLNDPSGLYKVSYEELQSLVLEHPYASNLWKLLLCKAYFEDKSDFPKILEALAIRIQDRRRLKNFMSILIDLKLEYDLAIETRQILDLDKLKEKAIERAMSNPAIEEQEVKRAEMEAQPDNTVRKDLLEELFSEEKEKEKKTTGIEANLKPAEEDTPSTYKVDSEVLNNIICGNTISNTLNFHREGIQNMLYKKKKASLRLSKKPIPKNSFKSWNSVNNPKKTKTRKPKNTKAKSMAAKSIMYNTQIASETLAKILEQQGYFDKAIKMYEQLCLKNPEKNTFFEAKIKNLKERR